MLVSKLTLLTQPDDSYSKNKSEPLQKLTDLFPLVLKVFTVTSQEEITTAAPIPDPGPSLVRDPSLVQRPSLVRDLSLVSGPQPGPETPAWSLCSTFLQQKWRNVLKYC